MVQFFPFTMFFFVASLFAVNAHIFFLYLLRLEYILLQLFFFLLLLFFWKEKINCMCVYVLTGSILSFVVIYSFWFVCYKCCQINLKKLDKVKVHWTEWFVALPSCWMKRNGKAIFRQAKKSIILLFYRKLGDRVQSTIKFKV